MLEKPHRVRDRALNAGAQTLTGILSWAKQPPLPNKPQWDEEQ